MAPAPFGIDEVLSRLADIRAEARQELAPDISRLDQDLQDLHACWPCDLPQGIIHSDLFPDNTFWDGDRLLAVLDWDTAGRGLFAYDLMITLLAWTFGEDFDWSLGHALCAGYTAVRPILDEERAALPVLARAAAVRFSVSRIIQFHLHGPPTPHSGGTTVVSFSDWMPWRRWTKMRCRSGCCRERRARGPRERTRRRAHTRPPSARGRAVIRPSHTASPGVRGTPHQPPEAR